MVKDLVNRIIVNAFFCILYPALWRFTDNHKIPGSEIIYGSDEVGEGPADRDGPPYAELPDAGHRSEDE